MTGFDDLAETSGHDRYAKLVALVFDPTLHLIQAIAAAIQGDALDTFSAVLARAFLEYAGYIIFFLCIFALIFF